MSFIISRKTSGNSKIEWIVPNLIVRNNVNLIDGRKSCGKSSVVAAVLGDWNRTPQEDNWNRLKNILWLTSEEDFEIDVKPRLLQYGIAEDQITTIDYKAGGCVKPILPQDKSKMIEFVGDNKINALVIDPFSELKPGDWSINDGDQMRSYMTSIVAVCYATDCTAFLPRHMRKSTSSFSGDDGLGSVQIKASIRHPLRIDVTEEKIKRRFLSVEESNIARPLLPLQFSFEDLPGSFGKLKWDGHKDIAIDEIKKLAESKVRRSKLEDAKVLLLEALKGGEKSSKVLRQEAIDYGIGDRTLDDAKADLGVKSTRKMDPETGNGHWVWSLPIELESTPPTVPREAVPQLTLNDIAPEGSLDTPEREAAYKRIIADGNAAAKKRRFNAEKKPKPPKKGPKPKKPKGRAGEM